ncbi:unnamed protein product [Microthlaspi erraticum]|uniref:Uncharacterized protein n=1 Tax=Microthlaspi erraticum TaxID=1685480 RepID=A0A6D2IXX8_9BRAS|nr:unnamed protein product [Microthlaspi erraticum]
MADNLLLQEGEGATAAEGNRSHHSNSPSPNEDKVINGADFISSLPDAILHVILSFVPTKFAIRTSTLSTRWKHVWCGTPSLSIDFLRRKRNAIMETLTRHYSALRITSSHLCISDEVNSEEGVCVESFILPTATKSPVDSLIEFGISEKMSLEFRDPCFGNYEFPDLFFTNSSLTQLSVDRGNFATVQNISWTSLRILFLSFCKLSDESFTKILSGSPLLESLMLHDCLNLEHLDLSGSLHLRRLDIEIQGPMPRPMQLVAPHVHCLKLNHTFYQCGLILSLAEACNLPFPTLKVEVLTVKAVVDVASIIPGIAKLLQNSPSLKKAKLDIVDSFIIPDDLLRMYLSNRGDVNMNQIWKPKSWVIPWLFPTSEAEPMRFMRFLLADIIRE